MIPLTATIRDDVYERYLKGRDATIPDVSFWACMFDSLRGSTYNVLSIEKHNDGRRLVTLDTKHLQIAYKSTTVEFLTIEEELVSYPDNIGILERRR